MHHATSYATCYMVKPCWNPNFLGNYKKNSKKFCFMNVIIGYISIVLYSDSSWSDTAISPEASFHMTPGKMSYFRNNFDVLRKNCMKFDIKKLTGHVDNFQKNL